LFCGLVLGASTGEKKVCINFPHRKKRPLHEIAEKVRIDATKEQKEATEAKAKLDADEARRRPN